MVTRRSCSLLVVFLVVCLSLSAGVVSASTTTAPASGVEGSGQALAGERPVGPAGWDHDPNATGGNDSTLRHGSTAEVPTAAASASVISVAYEVDRTPGDVGNVTVTYTATVPENVVRLVAAFNASRPRIRVHSATNMAYDPSLGAWKVSSSRGTTTTATLVYTVGANVSSPVFSGFNTVETADWAFVSARRIGARHSWSYVRPEPAFEDTLVAAGDGYASDGYLLLGPHDTDSDTSSNQSFTLVAPTGVTPGDGASTVLSGLTAAADRLAVGDADPSVTAFAVPEPIRAGGGARGESFWINAGLTLADTTWFHEYVHTRQAWVDRDSSLRPASDVEWLTEASGDYYGALLAWQTGGPPVSLADAGTATPTFTAPDAGGATLTFRLTVSDGVGGSDTDTVAVRTCALSPVSGPYDRDGDCVIVLTELGRAATDYANGDLTLVELGTVATDFANG